jgi:hypothetical protein
MKLLDLSSYIYEGVRPIETHNPIKSIQLPYLCLCIRSSVAFPISILTSVHALCGLSTESNSTISTPDEGPPRSRRRDIGYPDSELSTSTWTVWHPIVDDPVLYHRQSGIRHLVEPTPNSCITTGISSFAVCLRHTTKAILHSAKALPSVTLDKERSVNCTSATASLPSTCCRALGKDFVECHLALGKEKAPSRRQVTVTDPLPSAFCGTRQRGQFCQVFAREALGKDWSSGPHRQSLCREL